MVVREEVASRQRFSGGSPCVTRAGFFGGGRGATSSEWSSRAGSVGFVDLEQGIGRESWMESQNFGLAVGWALRLLVTVVFHHGPALTSKLVQMLYAKGAAVMLDSRISAPPPSHNPHPKSAKNARPRVLSTKPLPDFMHHFASIFY